MSTEKKKLVIITPEYSGNKLFDGGLSSFLDKFIYLINKKYEIHLITSSYQNKTSFKKNIILHEIKLGFFLKLIKFINIKFLIYLIYYPAQSLILNNFLKKNCPKFDLYFYTNFEHVSLFQPKHIKSILRISSFDYIWFKRGFLSTSISKFYDKIVLTKTSQIWSTSIFISKYIDKKFKKKIIHIPPFMNANIKIKIPKSLKKFKRINFLLFIGTISERKGIHLLPKLYSEIYKKNSEFKFVIIGRDIKNYGKSNFDKYFKNKNFSKNCIYFGVRKKNFFLPLIKYAKVVTVPSLIETSPQILQEILAYDGVPMCSKNTSMEELVKNDKDFLFNKNNKNDLVDKTFNLMNKKNREVKKKIKSFKSPLFRSSRKKTILLTLDVLAIK